MKEKEKRIHPNQKPVDLYLWILNTFLKKYDLTKWKILDTHVGSASSLIAFHEMNLDFVGFELDKYYYDLSKKRYEAETAQLNIFEVGL